MKRINIDWLLSGAYHALEAKLAEHAHEKHTEKSLRFYRAGYLDGYKAAVAEVKAMQQGETSVRL